MFDAISVYELNMRAKQIIDSSTLFSDILVTGEIANFVLHRTGHLFFSLRDEKATIKAVMFKSSARFLNFLPENGMKVIIKGRAGIYEAGGSFQLYADQIIPQGIGVAQFAFEQLKRKLSAEGLFDSERKKAIPVYPQNIGVITSKTGAALQDIINVCSRRWPVVNLTLAPVQVQGIRAIDEIVNAVRYLDHFIKCDVILIARGGGSQEDLWLFNNEKIARAVSECNTPVISAIGHEIDYTILDLVADLRAPTPSAAAEMLTPDKQEFNCKIQSILQNCKEQIYRSILERNQALCNNATICSSALIEKETALSKTVSDMGSFFYRAIHDRFDAEESQYNAVVSVLDASNPIHIMARGFYMVEHQGQPLQNLNILQQGDSVQISNGTLVAKCTVEKVDLNEKSQKY